MFAFPYQDKGSVRIHKMFLFGGSVSGGTHGDSTTFSGKIYQFDETNLLIKSNMSSSAGLSYTSTCQVGNNACIFGGTNSASYQVSSIQKYDGSTYSAGTESLANATNSTSAVAISGVGYIFGGNTGSELNTIQSYTGSVRSTTAYTLAAATQNTSACKIANAGVVNALIFGGWTSNFTEIATIQRFTGTARSTDSTSLPTSIADTCAASPESNNYPCWIFGGKKDSTTYNTINEYNNTALTTRSATVSTNLSNNFPLCKSARSNLIGL